MKRLFALLFVVLIFTGPIYARTITIVIPDGDVAIIQNDVADIEVWIKGMIDGKLNKCISRAAIQYDQYAKSAGLTTVPVDEKAKAAALLLTPGYQSKAVKEAEEKAKLPK